MIIIKDLWWGDQPLGSQYPSLFRVVLDKNIPISSVLDPTRPFSWNLNFRRNLSNSEIEDLEGLMRSLDGVHLSPSVPDARLWPLSSSGLFSVKSFFLALSQFFGSPQVFPSKFVWNSQIPFKVQSFIWLVAHKKVNTNDMLQVRRPYKALSPDICILCMKHGESADHIFLHCSLTIGLWHRLFQLAKMDWVPPRSILDMMYIKFNGFGSSNRGIALWQAANIALIRIVWRERNARILRIKQGIQSLYGTLLFSLLLFGLIVPRATEDVPIKGCGLCAAKVVSTTFSDSPSCSPVKGKKVAHLDGSKRALLGRTGTGIAGGCMLMLGI
ncbi:hypothetical protein CK203_019699 [Vitis vinifera]|uniref:Reverse transcriptase zinc-binding domain-containing protein n=1 Tax=Vitis vinifera TaxID=29760 RepID=A0A438JQX6_VITVI|nr:hypothetical protein CK203_019699 [Vitis vinifera]